MTVTEPEWDEQSRADAVALVTLPRVTHSCGVLYEDATDPDMSWRIWRDTCYACAVMKKQQDAYHEAHKDSKGVSDVHRLMWWVEKSPLQPGKEPAIT